MGIGSPALAWLTAQEARAVPKRLPKDPTSFDLMPKAPHFAPRARAMISLFHARRAVARRSVRSQARADAASGTDYPGEVVFSFVNRASKALFGSPWKFAKARPVRHRNFRAAAQRLAEIVDDVCLIRSMHTGANGHEVSIRYFHGGIPGVVGRPTLGSWMVYGLGCESQELPAYLVLSDPGGPAGRRGEQLVERLHAAAVPRARCCGRRSRGS